MIVADSDVLIDFLRGKGPGVKRVALELATSTFATTAITAFELRAECDSLEVVRECRALEDQFLPGDLEIRALEFRHLRSVRRAAHIHAENFRRQSNAHDPLQHEQFG